MVWKTRFPKRRTWLDGHYFYQLPDAWADALMRMRARGPTYRVALRLLRLPLVEGMENTVKIGNKWLEANGVDRKSKARALKYLERAGLIQVSSKKGSAPLVTLLPLQNLGSNCPEPG
jgi:hypothetical protein